jgi:hypothetical protein
MDKNDVSLVYTQIIFSFKRIFCENASISENNVSSVEATNVPLDMNFLPRYWNYFYQVIVP